MDKATRAAEKAIRAKKLKALKNAFKKNANLQYLMKVALKEGAINCFKVILTEAKKKKVVLKLPRFVLVNDGPGGTPVLWDLEQDRFSDKPHQLKDNLELNMVSRISEAFPLDFEQALQLFLVACRSRKRYLGLSCWKRMVDDEKEASFVDSHNTWLTFAKFFQEMPDWAKRLVLNRSCQTKTDIIRFLVATQFRREPLTAATFLCHAVNADKELLCSTLQEALGKWSAKDERGSFMSPRDLCQPLQKIFRRGGKPAVDPIVRSHFDEGALSPVCLAEFLDNVPSSESHVAAEILRFIGTSCLHGDLRHFRVKSSMLNSVIGQIIVQQQCMVAQYFEAFGYPSDLICLIMSYM